MTEWPREAVDRSADAFVVGSSRLEWTGAGLTVVLDERTFPVPSRLRGRVRVHPSATTRRRVELDPKGHHTWWPIAPRASVEVELDAPRLRWRGVGYFDSNWGRSPLEDAFSEWSWSRAPLADGAAVLYDVARRDADPLRVAIRFDAHGRDTDFEMPAPRPLPGTLWRVPRTTRSEGRPRVLRTLEDTPFYNRSVLDTEVLGRRVEAVHESLSLDRFARDWVKFLLTFRMPRARERRVRALRA